MTEEEIEKLESEYFRSYHDLRVYNGRNSDMNEISFCLQHPGGGVTGEIIVEWINLGYHGGISPKIKVFNDSIHVLLCFKDVIDKLHTKYEGLNYTPEDLMETLEECGFMNSKDSFDGDFIPEDMFKEYQRKRLQKRKRLESLVNLLDG